MIAGSPGEIAMSLLGQLTGGFVAILALAFLWEKLLFQRVLDDPVAGKLSSVIAAWVSAGILAGFGSADGGPFVWSAGLVFLIPALIVAAMAYRRGKAIRERTQQAAESQASVFE
jgi:hypothetical protein